MKFLERNLEDIIYNASSHQLLGRGLELLGKKARQVKIGNYGIADIVTFETVYIEPGRPHYELVNVVELKKDVLNIDAFCQCIRYMKGVSQFFKKRRGIRSRIPIIKGVLIGYELDKTTDMLYMPEMIGDDFEFEIYTYSYDLDGIRFQSHSGYCLITEGF